MNHKPITPEAPHKTFDVFDTAITRLVLEPHHLHWAVGRRLRQEGVVVLSDRQWGHLRSGAEDRLRQVHPHGEVTLEEIYAEIATTTPLTAKQMARAMSAELGEELRLVRPVVPMQAKIEAAAALEGGSSFITDTYFRADQVRDLLSACGYTTSAACRIFASSEHRQSKARGDLFPTVSKLIDTACDDIEHTGDNLIADVRGASSHGWRTVEYGDARPSRRERHMFAAGPPNFLSSAVAGAARTARVGSYGAAHPGIVSASASVIGPLLTAYVLWILLDLRRRGGRTLYFLARDGQILKSICDRLTRWLGWDIEARYLLASRQAYYLASLPSDLDDALTIALADTGTETILGVGKSLGFATEAMHTLATDLGLEAGTVIGSLSKGAHTALKAALRGAGSQNGLEARIAADKAATLAYFEQEGLFESQTTYIVDLGWMGNIQKRMQRAIGDRTTLFGYFIKLHITPPELEGRVATWTSQNWPREGLLETFALADHTTTQGFELAADGHARCAPPLSEEAESIAWGVREQQAVIGRFLDHLAEAVELDLYSVEELAAVLEACSIASFKHFCAAPSHDEATAYGGTQHAGDQNHMHAHELAPRISDQEAIRLLFDRRARNKRTAWYYGSLARSSDHTVAGAMIRLSRAIARAQTLVAKRRQTRSA